MRKATILGSERPARRLSKLYALLPGHPYKEHYTTVRDRKFSFSARLANARFPLRLCRPARTAFSNDTGGAVTELLTAGTPSLLSVAKVLKAAAKIPKAAAKVLPAVTPVLLAVLRVLKAVTEILPAVAGILKAVTGILRAVAGILRAVAEILP